MIFKLACELGCNNLIWLMDEFRCYGWSYENDCEVGCDQVGWMILFEMFWIKGYFFK